MEYTDEEIISKAHEVAESTGVSVDLLMCAQPEHMEALAAAVIQHANEQAPKVHAAPTGMRSRIIRGNGHAQTNGEKFADFMREQMRWA